MKSFFALATMAVAAAAKKEAFSGDAYEATSAT